MEPENKKVLCVGLCCLDIVMVCNGYPKEDSDQRCLSHTWQRGGNASNNATIFSEFEIPCEILGTISTDIGGQFMGKNFEQHKISTENCHFYDQFESPTSVIWINSHNGSRTIVHSNKNMPEVTFEDFIKLNMKNYSWIHFEIRPYFKEIKKMVDHIRAWNSTETDHHITISIEIEKPRLELMELINLGDVVFISKDFATACSYEDMTTAVEFLCRELRSDGVLICAWGDKGACAKTRDGPVHISQAYQPLQIVNTLGAGDTFVAAIIICFLKAKAPETAIQAKSQDARKRPRMILSPIFKVVGGTSKSRQREKSYQSFTLLLFTLATGFPFGCLPGVKIGTKVKHQV